MFNPFSIYYNKYTICQYCNLRKELAVTSQAQPKGHEGVSQWTAILWGPHPLWSDGTRLKEMDVVTHPILLTSRFPNHLTLSCFSCLLTDKDKIFWLHKHQRTGPHNSYVSHQKCLKNFVGIDWASQVKWVHWTQQHMPSRSSNS
jgi:hypothetical protein